MQLQQLRDIISAVYASKAEANGRCADAGEPQETMEQHLYAFLRKQHGLKSVVEEWARAIFKAIQRFAPAECDVAVFGKILQNSIAENFAEVQDTLRSTVHNLLYSSLHGVQSQAPLGESDAAWLEWMNCGVPLANCEEVVNFMYNEHDSEAVLEQLHAANSGGTDKIRYRDLVQILLSFQLLITEAYLVDFVQIFRTIDTDDDGVIDSQQLQEFAAQLASVPGVGPGGGGSGTMRAALAEAHAAAQAAIRPRRRATFSECVDIFSGMNNARHMVKEDNDEGAAVGGEEGGTSASSADG